MGALRRNTHAQPSPNLLGVGFHPRARYTRESAPKAILAPRHDVCVPQCTKMEKCGAGIPAEGLGHLWIVDVHHPDAQRAFTIDQGDRIAVVNLRHMPEISAPAARVAKIQRYKARSVRATLQTSSRDLVRVKSAKRKHHDLTEGFARHLDLVVFRHLLQRRPK